MEQTPSSYDELHDLPPETYSATHADINDPQHADEFWQREGETNDGLVREAIKQADEEEQSGKSAKEAFLDGIRWYKGLENGARFYREWDINLDPTDDTATETDPQAF